MILCKKSPILQRANAIDLDLKHFALSFSTSRLLSIEYLLMDLILQFVNLRWNPTFRGEFCYLQLNWNVLCIIGNYS